MYKIKTLADISTLAERIIKEFGIVPDNMEIEVSLGAIEWDVFCREFCGQTHMSSLTESISTSVTSMLESFKVKNVGRVTFSYRDMITFHVKRKGSTKDIDGVTLKLEEVQEILKVIAGEIKQRNL